MIMLTTKNEAPARTSKLREIFRSRSMQRHRRLKCEKLENESKEETTRTQARENCCPLPIVCVEYDSEVETHELYRVRSFKRTSIGLISLGDSLRARSSSECNQKCNIHSPGHNFKDRASFASIGGDRSPPELVVKGSTNGKPVFMVPSHSPLNPSYLLPTSNDDQDQILHQLQINQTTGSASPQYSNSHFSSICSTSSPIKVQLLGGPTVGKTTLCRQFLTSEFMGARTESFSEDSIERFVIIEVDGWNRSLMLIDNVREEASPDEEVSPLLPGCSISTIILQNSPTPVGNDLPVQQRRTQRSHTITPQNTSIVSINPRRKISCYLPNTEATPNVEIVRFQIVQADVYVVVYAVDEEISFKIAKEIINKLHSLRKPDELVLIYLVGNKTDLVRRRQVSTHRGKKFAERSKANFFEISTAINHLVDELLVDIVVQWRKKSMTQECYLLGVPVPREHPGDSRISGCHSDQSRKSWVANLSSPKNVLQRLFKQQFAAKSCINLQNS